MAERIELFYRSHPSGRIQTELINRDAESVTFKALVYRGEADADADADAAATGWATEREGDGDINTVACLENTETSAIGRALANLGFTTSKQRSSVEEMTKTVRSRQYRQMAPFSSDNVLLVAQSSPEHQNASADLLGLLGEAEAAGLPANRAQKLRSQIERGPVLLPMRIAELERSLRNWLHRREGKDVTGSRLLP